MKSIRTVICQPALPKYRLPVFAELAGRAGIDLTVWYGVRDAIRNAEPEGFDAEERPTRRVKGLPGGWNTAVWEACDGRFDVAVLSWNANDLTLLPAIRRARKNGVGVILWGHGYSKRESFWRKAVRNRLGKSADGVLLYDRLHADRLVDQGFDRSRVFVAANTLDDRPIESARATVEQEGSDLRQSLQLGDERVLLFVSRVTPKARLDVLLQALSRLDRTRLLIVGGGELDPLKSLAADLGLADRVVFVGPVYEERKLAEYFAIADVFPYPGAIGLSLIHSMFYGVPAIIGEPNDAQGPEVVAMQPGVTGLVHEDGNAADLAEKIRTLLGDEPLRQSMAEAARARARETFALSVMVDGMEASIRFAAGRR